jgi:hypothetical protein
VFVAASLALGILAARPAAAQEEDRTWHHPQRPPPSPQRFAFELRLGPYKPAIDHDFESSPGPYENVFGNDNRVFFGLELDWQAFRIPEIGTLGVGFGWSYTHMSAQAKVHGSTTGALSAEETSLSIMPMYGVGVLRVDKLARDTPIPLVGYMKAGLGYGIYWTGNDLGTQARGHTWGTQLAFGGMLMLDALDEHASIEIDNEWGINHTYAFFEYMFSNLNGLGTPDHSVMRIGTHTWVVGLAFEM